MKPPPEERKATSIGCCAAIFAVYLVSREGGRRRCAQTLLDKGLATVSRMGLSIGVSVRVRSPLLAVVGILYIWCLAHSIGAASGWQPWVLSAPGVKDRPA